jgi:hypothetical protein
MLLMFLFQNKSRQYSAATSSDEVLFEEVDSKRVIILNRPKVLNALTLNMLRMIYPRMLVSWRSYLTNSARKSCRKHF